MLSFLTNNDLSVMERVINICVFVMALIFSLTVHEFMHGYAAYKCGDDTAKKMGRLSFSPAAHIDIFGLIMLFVMGFGWAKPVQINTGKMDRYENKNVSVRIVSLAGVSANFVLGIAAAVLYVIVYRISLVFGLSAFGAATPFHIIAQIPQVSISWIGFPFPLPTGGSYAELIVYILLCFLWELMIRNMVLMAFNLIPIPPLDGYRFLESFFPYNLRAKLWKFERGGMFVLYLIMFFASSVIWTVMTWIYSPFQFIVLWIMRQFGV